MLTRVVGKGVLVVPLDMTRDTQTHDDVRIRQSQKSAIGCAEYQGFGQNKIAFDVVAGIVRGPSDFAGVKVLHGLREQCRYPGQGLRTLSR